MDQATPITTAAAVDLSSVGLGLAVDVNYAKVALTARVAPLAAVDGASAEPSDATDGFLSHPALLAPYRHIARLPTKDVRVHFLRALVAWMPVDPVALDPIEGASATGNAAHPGVTAADDTISRSQCNSTVQFERACGVGGLLHHLCTATRVLHTVSLLYDDIEDDSDTRRGEPCAHVRYGVAWTLNAASAATFAALHELAQCAADAAAAVVLQYGTSELIPLPLSGLNGDTPLLLTPPHSGAELDENQRDEARALWADALTGRLTKTCTAAMRRLHSGQGKDIWYRDMGVCPTMAEYDILCVEKTGGLFRLIADWVWVLHRPIAAAAAAAAARTRGGRVTSSPSISAAMAQRILTLCDRFGLCFQILDDYLNLCDDGAGVLKGYCEDLQEGKFSFLVVHAVWTLRQRSAAEATDPIGSTSTPNATDRCDTNAAPTVAAHNGLNSPAETELIALLRGRPRGRAEKDAILRTLHACGSFRAAVAAIEAHCDALATEVRGVDEAIIAAAGGAGTRAGGVDVVSGAVAGLLRLVDLMRTRAIAAHPCGALN